MTKTCAVRSKIEGYLVWFCLKTQQEICFFQSGKEHTVSCSGGFGGGGEWIKWLAITLLKKQKIKDCKVCILYQKWRETRWAVTSMFFLLCDTASIYGIIVKFGSSSQIETFLGHDHLSLEKSWFRPCNPTPGTRTSRECLQAGVKGRYFTNKRFRKTICLWKSF